MTNKKGTNIRVLVDDQTYSVLKSEQNDYYMAKKGKISLSNVLLHYFREGYNNANSESDSGLGVIKQYDLQESDQNCDQNFVQIDHSLMESTTKELEKKKKNLQLWEQSLGERKKELEYQERLNSTKEKELRRLEEVGLEKRKSIESYSNQEMINTKMEMIKIKTELEYLKDKINPNDNFDTELRQISRKLDKIENQTKKSTMDIIMQFAPPLISLIGFFQLNKKMNSSTPELEEIKKQIQNIFTRLDSEEKESILAQFDNELEGVI